jgi:predicted nucleotidyltransferase
MDFCPRLGQNLCMGKDAVIQTLQQHQRELNAAGIVHLRLFGSVARDEARDSSDIDLVADFDHTRRFTLLSMAHLENRLSDLLGAKVDLAPADSLRDPVRTRIQHEAIHAF